MPQHTSEHASDFPWGAVIISALVVLLVQTMSALLGTGVGLSTFAPESGESMGDELKWGAVVFAGFTVFVSFFLGGWLVACWAAPRSKTLAFLEGLAVWTVASGLLIFFAGMQVTSTLSGLMTQAGLGVGAAGGAGVALQNLEKVRVVSDLEILKGKVVTQIQTPKTWDKTLADTTEQAKREVAELTEQAQSDPEVREGAKMVRQASAAASIAAVGSLLLGFLASWLGVRFGPREFQHA